MNELSYLGTKWSVTAFHTGACNSKNRNQDKKKINLMELLKKWVWEVRTVNSFISGSIKHPKTLTVGLT
jgi:hypothetical protein